jgi:DNA-binding NarL/FixJ family response regulator
MPVKILLVDDHQLLRQGLLAILKNHNSKWELHEAENGIQAILKADEVEPDIILMDYLMPKLDGIRATTVIKKSLPDVKIIMVSMDMSPEVIIQTIQAGVLGIVSKNSSEKELLNAIDMVKNGKQHLSGFVSDIATEQGFNRRNKKGKPAPARINFLTKREKEVLKQLLKGLSTKTIADEMAISARTVDNHKANIFRKCHIHSTNELMRFALKANIVSL